MIEGAERMRPGPAQLFAWSLLAVVNQLILALDAPPARPVTRVLHHAYDAGQLIALGVLSYAAVELARRALARVRKPRWRRVAVAVAVALAGFLVSLAVVEDDVTNAADRHGIPLRLAVVGTSAALGLLLGGTSLLRAVELVWLRAALGAAGFAAGVANAFILEGDYPATHLILSWWSALLIAQAAEALLPRLALPPRLGWPALALVAVASFATLAIAPPQEVLRRLYRIPSAVVAPFAAQIVPAETTLVASEVPARIRVSPWFRKRDGEPPVPPSGALVLPEPKLVILITIDALRADVLSDPERAKRAPLLNKLKRRSAYFPEARAPSSSTRPSMAALFTGRYSPQLKWGRRKGLTHLRDQGPRLGELLSSAGVNTVSLPLLLDRIGKESGIARGFRREIAKDQKADAIVRRIIRVLRRVDQPTFIYAHFVEPHAPYEGEGKPIERYLQEVRRVDRALEKLVRYLDQAGLTNKTLLIISADHGEAFKEHGVGHHAHIAYEEVLRIPLLVSGPGVVARTIREPVSLIDVTPTILDAFGLPTPGSFMGQSLLSHLAGRDRPLTRPIAAFCLGNIDALYVPGTSKKVIFDGKRRTVEVYDLEADPGELDNLVDRTDRDVAEAIAIARYFFDTHRITPARPFWK